MQSKATTVAAYLAELPADRRAIVTAVRKVILDNLDDTYQEGMLYGMIGYYVPHAVFPDGYHCDPKQPLTFMALAAQKNYFAIYMMCMYDGTEDQERFRREWAARGKKLDMGKCCIRFKKIEDLCLDLIGAAIRRAPAVKYIAHYQKLRAEHNARPTKGKPRQVAAKSSPKKKVIAKSKPVKKAAKNPVKKSKSAKKN